MFYPDILLLNVCSLNIDAVNKLESQVNECNFKFLCFTETHLNIAEANFKHIEGYNLVSSFCRTVRQKGGVAIYALSTLDCVRINLDKFCVEKQFEVCGLQCNDYRGATTKVLVCYRSPDGDFNFFCDKLFGVLEYIYDTRLNIVLTGDFNIDASDVSKDSINYNNLQALLNSFNLHQMVEWPTRVTNHSSTIIDHIYTNFTNPTVCVVDNIISDHRTVLCETSSSYSVPIQKTICFRRSFSSNNISVFSQYLRNETWVDLFNLNNTDDAYNCFTSIFEYYFDICFPLRKFYVANGLNNKWVTDEVKISSSKLKDLFLLKNTYPILKRVYNVAKKQHEALLKSTKRAYYQNKIFNASNPAKMAWTVVSDRTRSLKNRNNITLVHENKIIEDPRLIANSFNDFFIKTPQQIIKDISLYNKDMAAKPIVSKSLKSLFLNPFTEHELYELMLSKLKNKASSGPDEIPTFIVKKVLNFILTPLTHLVNLSFSTGKFPQSLKSGKVIPVHKKLDCLLLENYRPITITSCFSKIFEYCFLQRLMGFALSHKLFSDNQHGFLPGRSTHTAVSSFYKTLIDYIEAGECPVGIFCDLSRAFDCVQHDLLLDKLYSYGIRGVALNWLKSFIKSRKQYVSITSTENMISNTFKSTCQTISMGVPQGSVLGPVLFLLYTNEIDKVSSTFKFIRYADDTSVLVSDKQENSLSNICTNTINNLVSWCNTNYLYFNSEKTSVIRFHNYQRHCLPPKIYIDNVALESTKNIKFLGLTLDANLNWKDHCANLISKLNSICFMFRNLRDILSLEQLLILYHSQVVSRLRYGVCFWGVSTRAPDVFIVQKRILRIIADVPKASSCRSIFRDFKILPLLNIFIFEMSVFVYINKQKFVLNQQMYSYNTRHCKDFSIPYCRYVVSSKSPYCLSLKIFNKLPRSISDSINIKIFKNSLKQFLFDNVVYTLDEFFSL